KGAAAVYWAEKQLGKPYVWAATGPGSFDCSGLTMWAYKKVGVSLSHYSRAQITEGARVSKSNLQPGDLVFFGSPIHHVGMYVGGGDFIEAPYTGAHVRITPLSNRHDFAGACRP
ncbi:MAG TPA: NlpC/P60 family protein, partial [Candidatus Limnocylindrales bacterium]